MATCGKCRSFFEDSKDALNYEPGKGVCVMERESAKGKFWTSKPVFLDLNACDNFKTSIRPA